MRFLLDTTLIYIYIYHIFFFGCFICQWIYHHQTPYFEIRWNHHCFWVPMFVAFYGYSCPQIYILANVLTGVCSIIIEFQPTYYQRKYVLRNHEKCGYPRTLTPANKNDSLYQTFVTIHPDYSSNTKNRFNALKFWSVFISKMLLKVNF